jgi:hypothetical protein
MTTLNPYYQRILDLIPKLPDEASIPLPVAELIAGVSRKTIIRSFNLVQLTKHRQGVKLGDLRRRGKPTAAASAGYAQQKPVTA